MHLSRLLEIYTKYNKVSNKLLANGVLN